MRKKTLSLLLAVMLGLSSFVTAPIMAAAGDFNIESAPVTIAEDGDYRIYGTGVSTTNTIVVTTGVTANVVLDNVNIDVSATSDACAFDIQGTSQVNLVLEAGSENTLRSGEYKAGLQVDDSAQLTIDTNAGTAGILNSYSGNYGAGIGGAYQHSGGIIIIENGVINAYASYGSGSGIGSGVYGDGCDITINGGSITATGNKSGAGIGSGGGGEVGSIHIHGGTVTASSAGNEDEHIGGSGIGSGDDGYNGEILIDGGIVTANGKYDCPGIGGYSGATGTITIRGASTSVTASGGLYAAAIGGGYGDDGGVINIEGGTITANGRYRGPGIGDYDDGTTVINISGGTVISNGGEEACGIGSGYYSVYNPQPELNFDGGNLTVSHGDAASYEINAILTTTEGKAFSEGGCLVPAQNQIIHVTGPIEGVFTYVLNNIMANEVIITAKEPSPSGYFIPSLRETGMQIIRQGDNLSWKYSSDTVQPVLSGGTAQRTSDSEAEITFTCNEFSGFFYEVVADGAAVPDIDIAGSGRYCDGESVLNLDNLTAGTWDVYLQAKDSAGNESEPLKIDIPEFGAHPSAENVSIIGEPEVGETITGTYVYVPGNIPEGTTAFRWLRVSATPSLLGEPYLLFTNNNVVGVSSAAGGPPNPCIFTVEDTTVIEKISNYHFASEDTPGTISLRKSDGTVYGPWDAVRDGYWRVYPDITIPAGTYTVIDSKSDSWSYNNESKNAGITEIVGYTIIAGATEKNYTLQNSDSGKSIMFEVTPKDTSENVGNVVKSNPFGPISLLTENQAPVLTSDWNYSTVNWGQNYSFTITVTDFENSPDTKLYSYIDAAAPSQAYNFPVVPGVVTITLSPSEGVLSAGSHTLNYYATDAEGATSEVLVLPFIIEAPISNNDATLSGLSASGITLSPVFDNATTSYSANVSNRISSTTINAVTSDDSATVTINGAEGLSKTISLNVGSNTITVIVTAEDGTTTKTYTVEINRAASAGGGGGGTPAVTGTEITVSTVDGSVSVTATLTETKDGTKIVIKKDAYDELDDADQPVFINAQLATVRFDKKAIDTIGAAADSGDVTLTIRKVASSELSDKDRALVGSRPVYDITVTSGGKIVSDFNGGHATVTIPYTLKTGENPNAVVIYYLGADGVLRTVRGHYDAVLKAVVFKTTHFSDFVIGYNPVSFNDVAADAWYKNAVDFIAARGITTGTGDNSFSPDAKLTRGQFVVLLMNAYQISTQNQGEPSQIPNFSDAGNTYYTDYLLAAKALGIVNGVGNNMFAPEKEITRQETFVMLYNALKVIDEVPAAINSVQLTDFNDGTNVADWANEALSSLVKAGTVGGHNNNLNPTATTTRAEIAQVLYNLLSK